MPDGAAVSEREAEVLAALGERLTNAEIALRLHISIRTVETHVSSLLRKLGAADRRALAAMAGLGVGTVGAGRQATELRGAPIAITSFVGRVQDRKVILEALRSQRLVTLVGVGGIGKTRLATTASIDALPGFAQAYFVDLVPSTPALVLDTVAGVVGAVEHPGVPLLEVLREHLGLASTLLVLDNCEHVRDEAAGLVGALLATTGATVLTTSCEPLGIPGERVVTVGPLDTMGDDGASGDAVVLFAERAREADPSFAVDGRLADVCARLDGMPLAIELAAARVGSLGIEGVSAGLADRLRFLRGGGQESPRHRSVEAMIDWSYNLLAPDEQVLFRRLGVFVAGFDLAGATAVAGTDASVAEVADLVGRLAARSLLSHRPAAGGRRWRLLEAVREYALAKLEEAGERAGTEAFHLQWAVETASALAADLSTTMGADADDVIDDLRAALARVGGSDEGAPGVNVLAGALARIAYARHAWEEAAGHAVTAVARASGPSQAIVAHRLAGDIGSARLLGDEAFGHYLAAADLAEAAGDPATAAVLVCEATVLSSRNHGEFATVVPLAERKRLFARASELAPADDPVVAAHLAATRAWHAYPGEPYDPAVINDALAATRRAGDPVLLSCVLDAELCLALDERRFSDAIRGARERVDLLSAMPRHEPVTGGEISDTLHSVLMVAFYAGDAQAGVEAAELLAADAVSRGLTYLAASRFVLPLAMLGDFDGALLHGAEMLAGWDKAGRPASAWMSPAARLVALVYGLRDNDVERERWNQVAGEMRSSLPDADPLEWFVNARVALHRGAAVPPMPEIDSTRLRGYEVALAAEVAAAGGRPEAAALIAAACDEWREQKWARACLRRAEARLTGDRHAMAQAADQFEALGARFEWACTRHLAGDADAGAVLRQLGCQPPAG